MIVDIGHALVALAPEKRWRVIEGTLHWEDESPQPTEEAIQTKIIELQAEYDSKKYQRDREIQYPDIKDVVVALAEKEEGDDTMWQQITAQRAKVKSDNPKPE